MNIPPLLPHHLELLKVLLEFTGKQISLKVPADTGIKQVVFEYLRIAQLANSSFKTLVITPPALYDRLGYYFSELDYHIEVMPTDDLNPDFIAMHDIVIKYNTSKPAEFIKGLEHTRQINIQLI